MNKARLFTLTVLCNVCICLAAHADGGMFRQAVGTTSVAVPNAPDQRAVIFYDEGVETLVLQDSYEGDHKDFSWVIPLPARPVGDEVATTSVSLFSALDSQTNPSIYKTNYITVPTSGSSGCGCGSSSAGGLQAGDNDSVGESVQVWRQMTVGPYQASILSAGEGDSLVTWLNDNDYEVPDSAGDAINSYVVRDWFFVALKVDVTAAASDGDAPEALTPIRVSFNSDDIIFPLIISSVNTTGQAQIKVYVISEHRTQTQNFTSQDVDKSLLADIVYYNDDFDYTEFLQGRAGQSSSPYWIVEYSGEFHDEEYFQDVITVGRDYIVTRFSTFMTASQMSKDVVFETDPDGDESFTVNMVVGARPNPGPERMAVAVLLTVLGAPALIGLAAGGQNSRLWLLFLLAGMLFI